MIPILLEIIDIINGKDWVTVCLSGITCGGKSTLARSLHQAFTNSIYIRQDDYFWGANSSYHPFIPSINHSNWETMASLDMDRMRHDVNNTLQRKKTTREPQLLIIEGFLVLNDEYLSSICDNKFLFVLDKDECKRRRERKKYTLPDGKNYFDVCIWPEYLKHKEEALKLNRRLYMVNGSDSRQDIFNQAYEIVNKTIDNYLDILDKK